MKTFTVHTGTAVALRRSNVDTDQIIPARFCTNPGKTGYADVLFADWRTESDFVLNQTRHRAATVLVAGENFGTGSSREAAVWALQNFGFRAVIAPRFADIFRANSLMNGLLTITLPAETVEELWDLTDRQPATTITIDLEKREIRFQDRTEPFLMDDDVRTRLLSGLDPISATLQYERTIAEYEGQRRATLPTTR